MGPWTSGILLFVERPAAFCGHRYGWWETDWIRTSSLKVKCAAVDFWKTNARNRIIREGSTVEDNHFIFCRMVNAICALSHSRAAAPSAYSGLFDCTLACKCEDGGHVENCHGYSMLIIGANFILSSCVLNVTLKSTDNWHIKMLLLLF